MKSGHAISRVLITGGTGFIGSRLALRCLEQGWKVRLLAQESTEAERDNRSLLEAAGAEILLASVTNRSVVVAATEGVETVFHLAATQHEMNVPDQLFRDVNVEGTRRVLEAATRARVRTFVHGSTIGVYGRPAGLLDEESPTDPDNIYGETKLEGERVALSYGDRLPVVVIRIPEVYGPGDRRLLKLFRAIEKQAFFLIGKGENLHHPIYVEDLVDGLLAAAEAPEAAGEVLLLGGKEAVKTREMVDSIARVLGVAPPRFGLPLMPFAVLATVLELTLRPLGVQPPLHRRRLDFFRKSFTLSAEKARRVIGFEPRTRFEEGARLTAEWYREAGLLPGREEPSADRPEIRGSPARTHSDSRRGKTMSGNEEATASAEPAPQPGNVSATATGQDQPEFTVDDDQLTARFEPFDSFWEAPEDIDEGYATFGKFYRHNYLPRIPEDRSARVLVISCGPGYFVKLLRDEGYEHVMGIDSVPEKVERARRLGLDCRVDRAFHFLRTTERPFDCIIAEQELNHLTKAEILEFMAACRENLAEGGKIIVHSINGANPLTGSESRAGNFDHYNSFTEHSLRQVLEHAGFRNVEVFPLDLYVFWRNPLNYVALLAYKLSSLFFRLNFLLVGKTAKIFSKKIGAAGTK